MDGQQLRRAILSGQRFSYLLFWGHETQTEGRLEPGCLSQWYTSPFEEDGVRYNTAEYYMMAAKARLFGDEEALAEILSDPEPRQARSSGRARTIRFGALGWMPGIGARRIHWNGVD